MKTGWLATRRRVAALALSALVWLAGGGCDDGGDDTLCRGVDCSGHGTCVVAVATPRCLCDIGWVESGLSCVVGGDGDGDADSDADGDGDADPPCWSSASCRDASYCNGAEVCDPASPVADGRGCVPGAPVDCDDGNPATADTCSEAALRCVHTCPDEDEDGHGAADCLDDNGDPLGDDCDDSDPTRYPGNVEVCDDDGHDEDCDETTVGDVDEDGDGWVASACCNLAAGRAPVCGGDCDDGDPNVHPAAQEVCDVDDVDENCDGRVNELLTVFCYRDWDDDGYGHAGALLRDECPTEGRDHVDGCPPTTTNRAPVDAATTDCDDARRDVHPGATEQCDRADNDCDGLLAGAPGDDDHGIDERDRDGDGYLECARAYRERDCADDDPDAHPGQARFFPTPVAGVGGFDYNCDGIEQHEFPGMGGCFPAVVGPFDFECVSVEGWFSPGMLTCGAAAVWVTSCDGADDSPLVRCLNVEDGWQVEMRLPECR